MEIILCEDDIVIFVVCEFKITEFSIIAMLSMMHHVFDLSDWLTNLFANPNGRIAQIKR